MSLRALAFLGSCLPGSLAFAQECADYRDLPVIRTGPFELGEAPRLIAATDSAVCWSVGSVLVWCPLDGDQPDLANAVRCTMAVTPASLRLDGARAAVTTSGGGWRIIDFTAPGAPVIAGMVEDGAGCRDADVQGNWVVAVEETGLALYELHPDGSVQERFRGQPDCTGEHHSSRTMSADIAGDRCWTEAYFLHETGGERVVPWRQEEGRYVAVDPGAMPGQVVEYALQSRMGAAWTTLASEVVRVPAAFTHLDDPRPNPFNPRTEIRFTLERDGIVSLTIHDLAGRCLRTLIDAELAAGAGVIGWDGSDAADRPVPSGLYVARLEAPNGAKAVKVTVAR